MDLLSLFKRESEPSASKSSAKGAKGRVAAVADEAALTRLRARRRVMGAAVLVILGVVGFPLVFGTKPRPVPANVPIEIVPRSASDKSSRSSSAQEPARVAQAEPDSATGAAAEPSGATASASAAPPKPVLLTTQDEVLTETAADAGREVQRAVPGATRAVVTKPADVDKPVPKPIKKPQTEPAPEKSTPLTTENTATSASSAAAQRFVVQLGAG
jgi:DedD protein